MQNFADRCTHLRKLQGRLVEEIRLLKESLQEIQQESFENPIETVNVVKSLQDALNMVSKELEKCPPE